ncbi:MAG TPA: 6-carboxytetrahydropterin synthase [Bacteroidia bacterium]|nr:6-carboxytetrahydropterin synthase [Bacteroidia bacterium]QQR95845.1 MAG: 6-carboxytetrahydropterin synthase [Bacteroidota bacterium]MBP7714757.1 6-carboxytetrahydropterin synthase [Bacteroidia bacterium]MBP8669296.1 6-carboxytetrahydropterin synthase [Bacteroidia bacterium]HQW16584.1 6-carboxytetrahydropterin synthase [Bacteroidia bacterium]
MIYITRKERFNAAHKLYKPEWSEEKNKEVFGKCSNPNWHGHNYELFITVKGMPNPETGFVIDLKVLSQIVKEKVIDPLDHKNINLDVKFMQGIMASTEMLAVQIWNQLYDAINSQGAMLHAVKLYETENNFVEYFGNEK